METIGPDRGVAWHVLGAVLRTLSDRLPLGLAAHLGAQLPLLVRGTYYDQFQPGHDMERVATEDEFLARVKSEFGGIGRSTSDWQRKAFSRCLLAMCLPGWRRK